MFVAVCTVCHSLALAKMEVAGRQCAVMNSRTIHNMALIDFVQDHDWMVVWYVVLFAGTLLYMEFRDLPRWSIWCTFAILAYSCTLYMEKCDPIAWKFL